MFKKLADFDIAISKDDNVLSIKRTLSQIVMEPEKKIKLKCNGVYMDENDFLDNTNNDDIYITIVPDVPDNCIIVKIVSLDPRIPEYIQVKKTDMISEVLRIICRKKNFDPHGLLKEDCTTLPLDMTVEECGIVDYTSIYVHYGNVTASVTNSTAEDESMKIEVNHNEKGLHLIEKVSSKLNISPDNLVLVVTNSENTKFEMIESNQLLCTYGITEKSVIKWIEVKRLNNIEIHPGSLNKSGTPVKVLKAEDKGCNQLIALKQYNIDFGTTKRSEILCRSKAFGNELINFFKLRKSDQFERIVKMIGIYCEGSNIYFAMELMGDSVRDIMDSTEENQFTDSYVVNGKTVKHITDRYVKVFTRQIIEGLRFLHGINIIHRNLKCSSVLLDNLGNVKLGSFGLSKYMIGHKEDELMNGLKGSRPTDFHWTSPETLQHFVWSVYTDIWSLGATVIEMRTGNKPHHEKPTFCASDYIIKNKRLDCGCRPAHMDDKTCKAFDGFILCCTREKPEERSKLNDLLQHEYLNC